VTGTVIAPVMPELVVVMFSLAIVIIRIKSVLFTTFTFTVLIF
jgi:hypothetical protein